ncbi:MAG TPA: hypothetical protein VNS53_10140 [Sphingomicrobium sp.]|jgi:hypothetical protein|nr:hypothetical protein [Sphingomicrobium sp.]
MRSLLLRLLAFVAVVLMPFGMAAAPAAPMQHQQMAMTMQHCPEPDSSRHSTAALADCTMACASALPATDLEIAGAHPVSRFTPKPMLVAALSGIELEIATPPPRRT